MRRILPGLLLTVMNQGVAFSPSQIANQKQWLDFSDVSLLFQDEAGTTPVTADGQAIGKAVDKSGQNNHATQATPTAVYKANIKNGRGMGLGNGTNSLLVTTFGADIPQPFSMFAVVKPVVIGNNHLIGGRIDTSTNTSSGVIATDATPKIYTYSGTNLLDGAAAANFYIISVVANGASSTIRVNSSVTNGDAGTRVLRQLGFFGNARAALWSNCYIGEFVLYTAGLLAADLVNLENYLNSRWSVF